MILNKRFKQVSGINDDNILEIQTEGRTSDLLYKIKFPDIELKKLQEGSIGFWLPTFSITFYDNVSFGTTVDSIEILRFSPVSSVSNYGQNVDLRAPILLSLYSRLKTSVYFSDLVLDLNDYSISFRHSNYLSVEIHCDDGRITDLTQDPPTVSLIDMFKIYSGDTEMESKADNLDRYTYTYNLYDVNNSLNFIKTTLILTSTDFSTVLTKTIRLSDTDITSFNLRSFISNIESTYPTVFNYTIYQEDFSDRNLGYIDVQDNNILLPNNQNNTFNFDYSDYYTLDEGKFLTLQPNDNKYPYSSTATLSYLKPVNISEEDIKVVIVEKNWKKEINSTREITWENIESSEYLKAENNNSRLDFYINLTSSPTIRYVDFYLKLGDKIISETRTFELINDCLGYKPLFFLNKIGGIDTFNRFKNITTTTEIDNNQLYYGSSKNSKNTAYKSMKVGKEYESVILTPTELEWAKDLCSSSRVFDSQGNNINISKFSLTSDSISNLQLKFTVDE